jgi:DNA-binding winged helix-turn-helix (wHTH) protein
MPSYGCYRFSRFELDLVRGCLREGDREIKLRPKAFVVLRHLVEQAGRLLSKDELMAAAWPGVHVSDGSLVQCIREIRRALDDDDQGCIKNVPGRGYLFAAPVVPVEPARSPSAPPPGAPLTDAPPTSPPRPPSRGRAHGRLGASVAVAVFFGAAIGVLAVRWLDGVPSASSRDEPVRQIGTTAAPAGDVDSRRRADDPQTELAYWQSVQASSDPRDFLSYLDQYPNGKFAALAGNRLRALEDFARVRAQQRADDAQRQADAEKAAAQGAVVAQRQAAELQRQTQAEAARRRAETDRVAVLETEVKRLGAAAAGPLAPAPPPAQASQAAPPPTDSPQLALGPPPRANLEGKWAGELGIWRFAFTVGGGEISGSLSCGNNIYRLREPFAAGRAIDVTANRVTGTPSFPTTIAVKGEFPTLQLRPISAPPPFCNPSQPFELRPVSAG